jgi:UDP-glucose 4-epimerase
MSSALIFGAGLIGTFAARYLVEAGIKVVAADLDPVPDYFARFGSKQNVELVSCDMLNPTSISTLLTTHKVDAIVLTAGLTGKICALDPKRAWEVNVNGTKTVAQCALDAGVKRLIFISSFAVYGNPNVDRITETVLPQPISEYGRTKVAAEEVLTTFRNRGLDVFILRPCGIYGLLRPGCLGSHSGQFIQSVLFQGLSKGEVTIESTSTIADEYLYVKDLARAITLVTLCDRQLSEFIFNVGSGQKTTVKDLCLALKRVLPKVRVNLEIIDGNDTPPIPPLDISRLQKILDFQLEYDLTKGLNNYLQEIISSSSN